MEESASHHFPAGRQKLSFAKIAQLVKKTRGTHPSKSAVEECVKAFSGAKAKVLRLKRSPKKGNNDDQERNKQKHGPPRARFVE